jgi:hypothetical protein
MVTGFNIDRAATELHIHTGLESARPAAAVSAIDVSACRVLLAAAPEYDATSSLSCTQCLLTAHPPRARKWQRINTLVVLILLSCA